MVDAGGEASTSRTDGPVRKDRPRGLEVLVLGMSPWAVQAAADALIAAGHRVVRCADPGEREFPCNGLRADRVCPLDSDAGADVVVVVRTRVHTRPAAAEFGVTCCLRRSIPLVVAGSTLLNPFDAWANATVDAALTDGLHDMVRACEDAVGEGRSRAVAGRKEHQATAWVTETPEESTCRSP